MPQLVCAHHEVKDPRGLASPVPGTDPDPTAGVHCAQMDGRRDGVRGRAGRMEGRMTERRMDGRRDAWTEGWTKGSMKGWIDG